MHNFVTDKTGQNLDKFSQMVTDVKWRVDKLYIS